MGELLAATLQVIAVLGLNSILDSARSRIINTQNGALDELDLSGRITTQTSLGNLSLAPGLRGRRFAASIRRGHASWDTESTGRVKSMSVGRVRVLADGLGVRRVAFRQTVTRRGALGRGSALVRVIERSAEGTLILMQEGLRRIAVARQVVLLEHTKEVCQLVMPLQS